MSNTVPSGTPHAEPPHEAVALEPLGARGEVAAPAPDAAEPGAEPVDVESLGRRARLGVILLAARTVLIQIAVAGGMWALARLLTPRDFGVFAIVQFALSFFAFFGDAGLGGAIVQRQGKPTDRELSSLFFAQIGVSLVVVAAVALSAPLLPRIWHDLPEGSEWLLRALSLGLLLTALRVVPSILMERDLLFGRLAALDFVVSVTFYVGAVAAAFFFHLGVWSLVVGVLLQAVAALALALALRPWRPILAFDWALLRPLFAFGLKYQSKNLIGFVNGAVSPVYAGSQLGAAPVGLVNWGQSTAYFPLKLVEIMGRVTFPVFAKLQHEPALFAETLGRALQICALGTLFFVGLFLGLGEPITRIMFGAQWLPALPILHIFSGAIAIGFVSPVVGAALDAAGRPGIFARLSLVWTLLNWTVVLLTTPRWGMLGFAAGYSVHVIVGNLAVLWVMRTVVPGVRAWSRFWSSALGGAVVFALARGLLAPHVGGWASLASAVVALLGAFATVVLVVDRRGVQDALRILPSRKQESAALV